MGRKRDEGVSAEGAPSASRWGKTSGLRIVRTPPLEGHRDPSSTLHWRQISEEKPRSFLSGLFRRETVPYAPSYSREKGGVREKMRDKGSLSAGLVAVAVGVLMLVSSTAAATTASTGQSRNGPV